MTVASGTIQSRQTKIFPLNNFRLNKLNRPREEDSKVFYNTLSCLQPEQPESTSYFYILSQTSDKVSAESLDKYVTAPQKYYQYEMCQKFTLETLREMERKNRCICSTQGRVVTAVVTAVVAFFNV